MYFVYILQCVDGSYYTGMTGNLELRVTQHQDGTFEGYTRSRRPVALVWSQEVETEHQAFGLERKIKGWTRAKKNALIRGDLLKVHEIVTEERRRRENDKRR